MPIPPPGIDTFSQLRFVTNFLLAGCGPERDIIFELNTDAAVRLAIMLVTFDISDIVQAFFDPRSGRKTHPERHGRKRRPIRGIPDINDEIGKAAHVPEFAQAVQKLPGARYVLPAINVVEAISISAFVLEGVSDIVYDNLAGVLSLNEGYCREFERFSREAPNGQVVGFPGPTYDPIAMTIEKNNTGFVQGLYAAKCDASNFAISVTARFFNDHNEPFVRGRLVLQSNYRGVVAATAWVSLTPGESIELYTSAEYSAGEEASWYWQPANGFVIVLGATVLGYGQSGWLDWLPD